jgi:dTDP-4-amino-4,6-dideoxy-D-galactose acyltransferase
MNDENRAFCFRELQWDTEFFGVSCAKAILNNPVSRNEWETLREKFGNYQFISIENKNSEPTNAQLIGTETTAFLADVNIQFKKKLDGDCAIATDYIVPEGIEIYQSLLYDENIVNIIDFPFSRFTEDHELTMRGGTNVYRQWVINSFEKPEKFYAIARETDGEINGFLLHSYSSNACIVELIAVSGKNSKGGIGTSLMKTVEREASQRGCDEIRVGTQVRNNIAINFYQKCGYKQVGCHQVYHLWRLPDNT